MQAEKGGKMKIAKQQDLMCRVIWAYMRTLEEYDEYDEDGNRYDSVERLKEKFGLTDKDVKDINRIGKERGYDRPIICNL